MDFVLGKYAMVMTPTARFDARVVVIMSLVIFLGATIFDLMETAFAWSQNLEQWQIDKVILSLFSMGITSIWFSFRRCLEIRKLHQQFEQEIGLLQNKNLELERQSVSRMTTSQYTNDQFQANTAECKRATCALHEHESRFRALVEHSSAGMCIFQGGRYHYVNPRFAEMFGYTVEGIMTMQPLGAALVAETDLESVNTKVRQLVCGEAASLRYTFRGKRKDGTFVDIEALSAMTEFEGRRAITGILLDITERNQAETALRFNRQFLQTVIDTIPLRISVRDVKGERLVVNRAIRALWGYTTEQLPPRDTVPHLDATNTQHTKEARLKVIAQGKPLHYERLRTLADGAQEWINAYWAPLRNEQADIIGTVCITENITQRKQAEAALQKSEAHQRLLVQRQAILSEIGRIISASPDINDVYGPFAAAVQRLLPFDRMAISLVDMPTRMITNGYVSGIDVATRRAEVAIPLSGTLTETTINAPQGILFHPRCRAEVAQRFPRFLPVYDAGLQSFLSIPLKSRNMALGALQVQARLPNFYTEQHRYLALSVGRQIAGAVATAQLYRSLQATEEALRESEQRFRGLIEHSPAAIFFKDREGCLRLVNPRFLQMYGKTEDEVLGKTGYEIAPRKFAAQVDAQDRKVLATYTMVEEELDISLADGERHAILVTKYPVTNASGEAIGVGTIHSDITDRKLAETRIAQHNEELRRAVQARTGEMEALMARMVRQEKLATIGQIAGSIAHELRNPLSVIQQSLFFLNRLDQRGRLASIHPKIPEYFQLMNAEINKTERVISQLLSFVRSQPPSPQRFDLRGLINDVLLQQPLGEAVRLHMMLVPQAYELYADPWYIQHVFLNLLSNANDACEGQGSVTIYARIDETAHQYHIAVRDTGQGIPDDELHLVFEPLFTRKVWGTGLGLSLCQQLIEQHGGEISLESQQGCGTTVTFRLPMPPPNI